MNAGMRRFDILQGFLCCWLLLVVLATSAYLYILKDKTEYPSELDCVHALTRIRAMAAMRPRLSEPLQRSESGLVLLGERGWTRSVVEGILYDSLECNELTRCYRCNPDRKIMSLAIQQKPALAHWLPYTQYYPQMFALVPTAQQRAVVLVYEPASYLIHRYLATPQARTTRIAMQTLQRAANASSAAAFNTMLNSLPESQAQSLVGTLSPQDRCFTHVFADRLAKISSGEWLPLLNDRLEESMALIASAFGLRLEKLLPLPQKKVEKAVHFDETLLVKLRRHQPFDTRLYSLANNVLSAWIATLGPSFANDLIKLRASHTAWRKLCLNQTASLILQNRAHSHTIIRLPPPPNNTCEWLHHHDRIPKKKKSSRLFVNNQFFTQKPRCSWHPPFWSRWCAWISGDRRR